MIVTDASVVLDVLLRSPGCELLEDRLFARGQTLHAPHLLDLEVAQVLRRYLIRREIDLSFAGAALELFARFPIHRYSHEPLLQRVWALRGTMTAYDAAYVALAEGLGAPLVTRDRKLAAASGHQAKIDVV